MRRFEQMDAAAAARLEAKRSAHLFVTLKVARISDVQLHRLRVAYLRAMLRKEPAERLPLDRVVRLWDTTTGSFLGKLGDGAP